jgi:thiamine pyrophosphokinase
MTMEDKQKRFAMLVSGSPSGVAPEMLWELAEGMSFVVAVDAGADWCYQAALIPDLLVGDLDSVSAATRQALAAQEVEELVFERDKDSSDLELALGELLRRGCTDLVATNVLGGRLDHELAALGNLSAAGQRGLAVTVVEPSQTLIFLNSPGARSRLRIGFGSELDSVGETFVSLMPWGGPATVSASGFKWALDHATLDPGSSLGLSNVPTAAEPLVELHSGSLIVVVQAPAV